MSRNFVIVCHHIKEEYSVESFCILQALLEDVTEEWHIPAPLPGYVVTDNARNFVATVSH